MHSVNYSLKNSGVSDGAPHLLRVRRADRRPLPAGGGRRRVAHRLPALLRLRSAARPPPLLLFARHPSLLQARLRQVSHCKFTFKTITVYLSVGFYLNYFI